MWIVWLEKKILKTLGILLGIIIILVTAIHVYVVNNAEKLIEDLVGAESKGKLRLRVDNIKFNYFSKKVELENVTIYSNDSLDLHTAYHFQVDNIRLQVKALLPIFTRRELRIDSLFLSAPKIEVTRLKTIERPDNKQVSIPQEMGRIYNSIMDALKFLEVKRFQFDDGQFRLVNKIIPDQQPLEITRLHFHIDNFRVDSTTAGDDFPNSDQMVFRTRNQQIIFPDGNHRMAFSRFRINIRKELIEIDSCTLTGIKSADNRSGFSVFFDTLKLTRVDFKSLYEKELIKADSVYCLNPDIKLEIELKERKRPTAKALNLDTIIHQLTGDMQLGYIGVKNAALNITTHRDNISTSFSSDKNNFEMQGLVIDHSLPQPVSLAGFDMAIRNYENFVKDSSYFLRFDSIRLRENKISLSNFSINTDPYKDTRNIKVQQFVLSGLSWADLLFDRKIVANQAVLLKPDIDFVQKKATRQKQGGPVAASLAGINNVMSLQKIKVENGKIKIKTLNGTDLLLEDASVNVRTNRMTDSISVEQLQTETESIQFKKGMMRTRNLVMHFDDVSFNGAKKELMAAKARVYNHQQTFSIVVRNFRTDSIYYDEKAEKVIATGISWKGGNAEINPLPGNAKAPANNPVLDFRNIRGENTLFNLNSSSGTLSVFLNSVFIADFERKETLSIASLEASGKDLNWFSQFTSVSAASFTIKDQAVSSFTDVDFKNTREANSIMLKSPALSFIPDVNSIISKNPELKNLKLMQPEFRVAVAPTSQKKETKGLPDLHIDEAEIIHPVFRFENTGTKGIKDITWNGGNNTMMIKNIVSVKTGNRVSVDTIISDLTDFSFTDAAGKKESSGGGKINYTLTDFSFLQGDVPEWRVKFKELDGKNFKKELSGKTKPTLILENVKLKNFVLGSGINGSLKSIIEKNNDFTIKNITARIDDVKNKWRLYNLSYSKPLQEIFLDSFSFQPQLTRDAFINASHYQTDYMTLKSASVRMKGFNIDQYLQDSSVRVHTLAIESPFFTSYRDKRPPFNAGIIKPLAAKLVQKIPVKISIDTVQISNGTAVYTELNDKTNDTGVVPVTRMEGDIFPIKNFNISQTDSLRIRLNFYLLDSAWIRLRTRESYLDTLSGFLITLRMRPGSMLFLNEILPPLASVKLQSGYLDTLSMRAVGREHLSLGEMRMFYHNLKVQFLKNGSEEKKRFLSGLVTFIANSFVIRKSNTKKAGVVYFPRLRDRSFINYFIKIAMSGVASSIGAKKNKKLLRKYKRQLKIRQLPPIDFD